MKRNVATGVRRCVPATRSYRESAANSVLRRGQAEWCLFDIPREATRVIRRANILNSPTYTRLAFCRMRIDG